MAKIDINSQIAFTEYNSRKIKTYELYSIIVHIGVSPNKGHYFTYIKLKDDNWYKFDSLLSKKKAILYEVKIQLNAYFIFYREINQ